MPLPLVTPRPDNRRNSGSIRMAERAITQALERLAPSRLAWGQPFASSFRRSHQRCLGSDFVSVAITGFGHPRITSRYWWTPVGRQVAPSSPPASAGNANHSRPASRRTSSRRTVSARLRSDTSRTMARTNRPAPDNPVSGFKLNSMVISVPDFRSADNSIGVPESIKSP